MSKKQTRRTARDSFPKAKGPAPAGKPAGGKYSSKGARERAKATSTTRALRPPSWKRAARNGAILSVLYFVVIQFLWKGSTTPNLWGSLIIAVVGFAVYTGIAYYVDRYTYNRKLRKLKGEAK